MSQPQDQNTPSSQSSAVDVESELSAVKNFSFIGAVVFLAFLVLLFSFETSEIELQHQMRSSPDLDADRQMEFEVKLEGWVKSREQTRKAALDAYLTRAELQVVSSNLGLVVTGSDAGLSLAEAPPKGTAAAKAGLAVGDVLRGLGGVAVRGPESYAEALSALVGTEKVRFEYLRAGAAGEGSGVYLEAYQPREIGHAAEQVEAAVLDVSARYWSVIKREQANAVEQLVQERKRLSKEEGRAANGQENTQALKGIKARITEIEERLAKRKAALLRARDLELIGATDLIASKFHMSREVKALTVPDKETQKIEGKETVVIADTEQNRNSLTGGLRASEDGYWGQLVTGEVELDSWRRHQRGDEQRAQDKTYGEYARVAGSILEEYFGSPEKPVFKGQSEISDATLAQGGKFYREHCSHCHGMSGYGDGPTAPFLNPRPRNYTFGKFKLRTNKTNKPTLADIKHTLKIGMQGSMMPPFVLYKDSDLQATAAYVKYLAVRGETEWLLYNAFVKPYDNGGARSFLGDWEYNADGGTIDELVEAKKTSQAIAKSFPRYLSFVLSKWSVAEAPGSAPEEPENMTEAQEAAHEKRVEIHEARKTNAIVVSGKPIAPDAEEFAASLRRGEKLFLLNCKECHGWDGTGGGEKSEGMKDEWGLKPEWGYPIAPRNLTRGIYRGGGRPIDIYYRIAGGITGSGMPVTALTPEQRWDLVNYVKSLAKSAELKN